MTTFTAPGIESTLPGCAESITASIVGGWTTAP
jgi:hypothetical protein